MSRELHITRYKIWSGKALNKKENKKLHEIKSGNIYRIKSKNNLESLL